MGTISYKVLNLKAFIFPSIIFKSHLDQLEIELLDRLFSSVPAIWK